MENKNFFGKISSLVIERYRIVYLFMAMVIILGLFSYTQIVKEQVPEVNIPYVAVITPYVGASPEDVENQVTDEIESAVSGMEDMKEFTSNSTFGQSLVILEFEPTVDIDQKLMEVTNNVNMRSSSLPDDANEPIVMKFDLGSRPIMTVNISGDYELSDLTNFAEDLETQFEKISGVKDVSVAGGLNREINVVYSQTKLAQYGLEISDIENALKSNNMSVPVGEKELNGRNFSIRSFNEFVDTDELDTVIVGYQGGNPIFLRDVATVVDGYEEVKSYARMALDIETGSYENLDLETVVSLNINKIKGADTTTVSNEVKAFIESKRGIAFPEDLNFNIVNDQSEDIKSSLSDVFGNAFSGLLLVIVVLFIFIDFKESLIVALVIPMSLLASTFLMYNYGLTFNGVSMLALILALGMLVDNAIVIMENIERVKHDHDSLKEAAKIATNQVAPAVFSSTLTTVSAFLPMAMISGIMGEFLKVIPITLIFAIGSSFIMSLTVTPSLCARLLKKDFDQKKLQGQKQKSRKFVKGVSVLFVVLLSMQAFANNGKFTIVSYIAAVVFGLLMYNKQFRQSHDESHEDGKITKIYIKALENIVKSKARILLSIGLSLVLFVGSVALIPLGIIEMESMPATDSVSISIDVETPSGSLLSDTDEVLDEIYKIVVNYPEVKNINVNAGSQSSMGSTGGVNKATVTLELVDNNDREKHSSIITKELMKEFKEIPGAKIDPSNGRGFSNDKPVTVKLSGDNLEELKAVSNDLKAMIEAIPGTINTSSDLSGGLPQLVVEYNGHKASYLGLNPMAMGSQIRNAISGVEATTVRFDGDEIKVVLKDNADTFTSIYDLEKINFKSYSGNLIPFSEVAKIVEKEGVSTINHESGKRTVTIGADLLDGYNANRIVGQFKEEVQNYPLGEGMAITYGGESSEMMEMFSDLAQKMMIAIIMIYIVLAVQFNSMSQPIIILFTVPLAMIGVMPGHALVGINFSTYSFMGIISLVGIAVNEAIVMIDFINHFRRDQNMTVREAVIATAKIRFIPIMATTITTVGGILPLALYNEEYAAMGYTIVFGLLAASFLTLIIIPCVYIAIDGFVRRFKKRVPIMVDEVEA